MKMLIKGVVNQGVFQYRSAALSHGGGRAQRLSEPPVGVHIPPKIKDPCLKYGDYLRSRAVTMGEANQAIA